MRDDRSAAIEEIKGLSDWRGDDYITSSLDHLFFVLTPEEIRDAALPSLTDLIETSPNPQAVLRCIDLLGRLVRHAVERKALRAVDACRVVGTLSGALTHEHRIVRSRAASVLGRLGIDAASVVPALQPAEIDEVVFVRQSATKALNRIRSATGVPSMSPSIETSDVVLALSFDDGTGRTAEDASPYGNDGSLEGNPQWVAGKFGKALRLDGASYVRVANDESLNLHETDFTFALWLNLEVDIGSSMMSNSEGLGHHNKWIWSFFGSGVGFYIHSHTERVGVGFGINSDSWRSTPGQWHHAAFVKNGDQHTCYLDGTSIGVHEIEVVIPEEIDSDLTIGQSEGKGYVKGIVDELLIVKLALSQEQIQHHIDGGIARLLSSIPKESR